jgi:hypothetical protein
MNKRKTLSVILCALTVGAMAQTALKVNRALVPANGNFYLLSQSDVPMPPMPFDPYPGLQVYSLGDNRFVIDDRSVVAAKEALRELREMSPADEPGIPGEGGSTDGGAFSPMDTSYMTNGSLWIEIASVDLPDNQITLLFHNTTNTLYYQWLSKTDLVNQAYWTFGDFLQGNAFTNATLFNPIPMTQPINFFRGVEGFPVVSLQSVYGDLLRPASTNAFVNYGYFVFGISDMLSSNLDVVYTIGGTATNGVDYAAISNSVPFPPYNNVEGVNIQPLYAPGPVFDETVILTVVLTNGYVVNPSEYTGTMMIYNNWDYQTVSNLTLATPTGIDYNPVLTNLVVSVNGNYSNTNNFVRLGTNSSGTLTVANWSGVQNLQDEVKVAVVINTTNGFTNGDMYFGNGTGVGKLAADGTANPNWGVLSDGSYANTFPLRGGLYVDRTGTFSNNLIVVVSDDDSPGTNKGVWEVDAQAHATLLAGIPASHLEGVVTLTNDVDQWGPWAGKIITGDEIESILYAIDTNGVVTSFTTSNLWYRGGIRSEDFDIIPTNQDLYICSPTYGNIYKLSRNYFTNYVGDLLITQAGETGPNPGLFIVSWDNSITNFVVRSISYDNHYNEEFEHASFAPIDLPAVSP